jgi:imidazolonepropionase
MPGALIPVAIVPARGCSCAMADFDLLLTDVRLATLSAGDPPYGIVEDAALGIADGRIAWAGARVALPAHTAETERPMGGRWVTPALIDCHTHLVFGGDRADEYERRLEGASYQELAAAGGGILSTVRATREADIDDLYSSGIRRLRQLAATGVATVEIKSGYGLDTPTELKMLAVAGNLDKASGVAVVPTLLAAHAVPPEFEGRGDAYIDQVIAELLPEVAAHQLANAVDAYCETIAFSAPQVAKLFRAAAQSGLRVKLHADQLSDMGAAELAAHFNALSADHLEYSNDAGIRSMAASGTVAVLLPGAYVTLGETRLPPVESLREHRVPIAIATDCNPGTSPLCSMPEAMALASRLFRLTPAECLAGATREAARALGLLHDRGTIEAGKRADLAVWNIEHPRDLSYWLGRNPLELLFVEGQPMR